MNGLGHEARHRRKRAVLCCLAGAIALLAGGAAPAFADSVTLNVTTSTGASDPAAGVGRVFTLSGTSAVSTRVYVKYRAPGGAPCAPSADTDSGAQLWNLASDGFYGRTVNGAFNIARADTWETPGTYVFCFWLAARSDTVTTPFTQAITFRAPTGTITATINPISPRINEPAAITVTGASEAPAYVFAAVRAGGGAPCAPTFDADTGTRLLSDESVNGAFSLAATTTQATAGAYLLCLWLADSSSDPTPIAGPQPQPFTVLAPPPPPVSVMKDRVGGSASLRRRGSRYSGRINTRSDCNRRRTVVLRKVGSGTKSFGRTLTRSNGTFTIRRSRRVGGRVYVVIAARAQGNVICGVARSQRIRG